MFNLQNLLASIADLESLAKDRLKKTDSANADRLQMLSQLVRYGVCTCHCHFSTSVYHSAVPCCGNARLKAPT